MANPTCGQNVKRDGKTEVCGQPAVAKYYWPGREPRVACLKCAGQVQGIADALGFHLVIEEAIRG